LFTAVSRSGVSFTEAERDFIQSGGTTKYPIAEV
jgi:hypothetical protein